MKGVTKTIIIISAVIILAVLVWGIIGAQQAKEVGVTCDMGIGEALCWTWHTNIVGEFQEFFDNTGDAVKDLE
jgi:choline-glycine betaine transporter